MLTLKKKIIFVLFSNICKLFETIDVYQSLLYFYSIIIKITHYLKEL